MHNQAPIQRRKSKRIYVGNVPIGDGAPIAVQSMTNTRTTDVAATVNQIKALERVGADIVRVSVPTMDAAEAFKLIKQQVNVPLVADIHFDKDMGNFSGRLLEWTDEQNHSTNDSSGAVRLRMKGAGMSGYLQSAVYNLATQIGVNVKAGDRYLVKAYIRGEKGRYSSGFSFGMEINQNNNKDNQPTTTMSVNDDWQEIYFVWKPQMGESEKYNRRRNSGILSGRGRLYHGKTPAGRNPVENDSGSSRNDGAQGHSR